MIFRFWADGFGMNNSSAVVDAVLSRLRQEACGGMFAVKAAGLQVRPEIASWRGSCSLPWRWRLEGHTGTNDPTETQGGQVVCVG